MFQIKAWVILIEHRLEIVKVLGGGDFDRARLRARPRKSTQSTAADGLTWVTGVGMVAFCIKISMKPLKPSQLWTIQATPADCSRRDRSERWTDGGQRKWVLTPDPTVARALAGARPRR